MCKYCDGSETPLARQETDHRDAEIRINGNTLIADLRHDYLTAEIDFCPKCGTPLEKVKPLTVEQLREKDAKPIFVVSLNGNEKTWCIMSFPTDIIETEYTIGAYMAGIEHTWYSLEDYGTTWIAYLQEPNPTVFRESSEYEQSTKMMVEDIKRIAEYHDREPKGEAE